MFDHPQVQVFNEALATVRRLTAESTPYYHYYFPPTWGRVLKRMLGFEAKPDFGRYVAELKPLGDQAKLAVEAAVRAKDEMAMDPTFQAWPIEVRQVALLCFQQVYFEGCALTLFAAHVRYMVAHDSTMSVQCFLGMQDMQRKAGDNAKHFRELDRHLPS